MKVKWNSWQGLGLGKNPYHGGGMDVFWKYTCCMCIVYIYYVLPGDLSPYFFPRFLPPLPSFILCYLHVPEQEILNVSLTLLGIDHTGEEFSQANGTSFDADSATHVEHVDTEC